MSDDTPTVSSGDTCMAGRHHHTTHTKRYQLDTLLWNSIRKNKLR